MHLRELLSQLGNVRHVKDDRGWNVHVQITTQATALWLGIKLKMALIQSSNHNIRYRCCD